MNISAPTDKYDRDDQRKFRAEVERADRQNIKRGRDIELSDERLIIRSPNGSRFAITVSNAGALSATAL